jgi:hypothetical protein
LVSKPEEAQVKLLAFGLLMLGELIAIGGELLAARSQQVFWPSVLYVLSVPALLGGYKIGYAAYGNIWTVTVLSITSILIVEPILSYTMFQTLPQRGALLGLILGSLGLIATAWE